MKSPRMLSILAIAITAMATPSVISAPPVFQLVGTSEIGTQLTACTLNTGNGEPMQSWTALLMLQPQTGGSLKPSAIGMAM